MNQETKKKKIEDNSVHGCVRLLINNRQLTTYLRIDQRTKKRNYSVPPKVSRIVLVTFAKLQRELFRKIRQKRESLAIVTRCVRTKCVGTL